MSTHPYVSEWRESRLQGMTTTLLKIRAADPCGLRLEDGQRVGYLKLKHHLGKGHGDDTPVDIATIIDNNGLDYALWCLSTVDGHAREMLLYADWCARQVPSLMELPRSVAAPAERYANGAASDDELAAARDARDAARAAQADELRRVCAEIAAGRDPYPAAGVIA